MTQSPLFKNVVFQRQSWLAVAAVLLLVLLASGPPSASGAFNSAASNANVVTAGDQFLSLRDDVSVPGSNFTDGSLAEENSPNASTVVGIQAKGELPDGMPVVAAVMLFSGLTLFVFGRRPQLQ